MFAKKGYDGTALSEIANGVGIKKPSLYAHFNGKEDLFLTVFREVMANYVQAIKAVVKETKNESIEVKLREILFGNGRFYMTHEDEVALMKRAMLFPPGELAEALRSEFLVSEKATNSILIQLFEEGIASGIIRDESIDDLLASYYCLVDGLFIQIFYYSSDHFESKMRSAWKIFWKGVALDQ
ncbi:TetR/AcrR family transcriptional regulator [Camelliibacillus cellulosilyticus]|uniref:TetR/AcrR family transcriptional regulator n=1 Tax=Camelliibacillus cellulosilyticus TaxID=2174486 RepID=A0ABV9GMJ1_9BACL